MKKRVRGRYALLGIASAAALISAIASSNPVAQPVPLKKTQGEGLLAASAESDKEMVSRLIVKHRAGRSDKLDVALKATDTRGLAISSARHMTILRRMSGDAHVIKLEQPVTLTQARAIADRLQRDSDIELAEPDQVMRVMTTLTPADPAYASRQWHYQAPATGNRGGANLPDAWWLTLGAGTIRVAVLDSGYRQHEDFGAVPGNILPGYDFISDGTRSNDGEDRRDADATDPGDFCSTDETPKSSWHGTHVAGTIGAAMNNTIVGSFHGTGIAPRTSILPVRVIGRCGGMTSDIVDGMRWAAGIDVPGVPRNTANPAQILNMSVGGSGACSATFQSAVNDVINAGKSIVAAAGNDAAVGISQPANCAGVIAVVAHALDGDNAAYSNIGSQAMLSAPGGGCGFMSGGCVAGSSISPGVYSLSNAGTNGPGADSYQARQGTSMAAPHVSGVIALMLARNPMLTQAQIRSYLQSSARPHPETSTCTQSRYAGLCGEGLLDGYGAIVKADDAAPTVSLASAYQVVAPNAAVSLSSANTVMSGRTIAGTVWLQQSGSSVGVINAADKPNATFTAPTTGVYTFRHTVTDSAGKTGAATATVRVNSAPVLIPVPDQTAMSGGTVRFTVSATDPDSDTLFFSAEPLPHESATLNSATGEFSWSNAVAGDYSLAYRASDQYGAFAAGTVKITVAAPTQSGGGGSLDGGSLLGLAFLAGLLRLRRSHKASRQAINP